MRAHGAAPPLDLTASTGRRRAEPQTETGGGRDGGGRGGAAPPSGGGGRGGSGWAGGGGDDEPKEFLGGGFDPFRSVVAAIRTRAAAEPRLPARLLALAALDVAAVLLVNYAARRARFSSERQQVATQAVVSALNTLLLGFLLPPAAARPVRMTAVRQGGLRAGLATLPPHFFAASPMGATYGWGQRLSAAIAAAAEFGAVGSPTAG